jgi:hypothetical protein
MPFVGLYKSLSFLNRGGGGRDLSVFCSVELFLNWTCHNPNFIIIMAGKITVFMHFYADLMKDFFSQFNCFPYLQRYQV